LLLAIDLIVYLIFLLNERSFINPKIAAIPRTPGTGKEPSDIALIEKKRGQVPFLITLNKYLRQLPGEAIEVAWPDEDVLLDLDTPEDYERLTRRCLEKP
jgi:hypothetical protein